MEAVRNADMEPRKKRKVEPVPAAAPTSAFALRKRLQQQKEEQARAAQEAEAAQAAAVDVDAPSIEKFPVETPKPSRTRKAKKTKEAQPAQPEDPVVAVVAVAPVEPPAPVETPAPVDKIVQLISPPARGPVIIRSSFQPNSQNFQKKAKGHLHLKIADDQRLVILGSYGLTVREGEVTLAGAILRASDKTHWVHAPRCHALPVLRCTDDAYIILQPHPAAPALREMAKLSPIFQNIWNEPKPDEADSTFQIIYTSDDCQAVTRDLSSPAEWNKLIAELTKPKKAATTTTTTKGQPVFFVCGPKSSGKSTFSRLLANRILTADGADGKKARKWAVPSLAVLDIDPGQPEYGTPGSLSLVHVQEPNLAPTFCHPYVDSSKLLRAHETATVSPSTDPEHYIECVMDLFSLYRRDLRSRCPLVVNTPGWIQGTGLEILKTLAARMQATKVIYMSQEGPEDTVQGLRSAYPNVPLVELPSQPGDLRVRTAAHLRSMQTMAYFHLDLDGTSQKTTKENKQYLSWHASPLTAVRPWTVPYSGPESGILGITCYDSQPPPHLIADTINGTIASVVAIQNAAAFRTTQHREARNYDSPMDIDLGLDDIDDDSVAPTDYKNKLPPIVRSPEGIPFILNPSEAKLDPRHSHKLGIALVRGIDRANNALHLLTPLPVDELLEEVMRQDGMGLVLVSGKFDVPTWAYTEDTNLQNYKVDKEGKEDKDEDDEEEAEAAPSVSLSSVPWVQVLQGRQARDAGSQVWRVRRDLGRNTAAAAGGE